MDWITVYGNKLEFMLDKKDWKSGFSSLCPPWAVSKGITFAIDVSHITTKKATKKHIKVKEIELK